MNLVREIRFTSEFLFPIFWKLMSLWCCKRIKMEMCLCFILLLNVYLPHSIYLTRVRSLSVTSTPAVVSPVLPWKTLFSFKMHCNNGIRFHMQIKIQIFLRKYLCFCFGYLCLSRNEGDEVVNVIWMTCQWQSMVPLVHRQLNGLMPMV